MDTKVFEDYVRSDARLVLATRIRVEEKQLVVLRKQLLSLAHGSDERVAAALDLTHARTRLDALKEAWMILTGEAF